jgi:hypothetical protein
MQYTKRYRVAILLIAPLSQLYRGVAAITQQPSLSQHKHTKRYLVAILLIATLSQLYRLLQEDSGEVGIRSVSLEEVNLSVLRPPFLE